MLVERCVLALYWKIVLFWKYFSTNKFQMMSVQVNQWTLTFNLREHTQLSVNGNVYTAGHLLNCHKTDMNKFDNKPTHICPDVRWVSCGKLRELVVNKGLYFIKCNRNWKIILSKNLMQLWATLLAVFLDLQNCTVYIFYSFYNDRYILTKLYYNNKTKKMILLSPLYRSKAN